MVSLILIVITMIVGIILLTYSSTQAIKHTINLASSLQVRSLMIGLIVVSIGTDLPEIVNSLVSCAAGYGDINIGDSLGSILSQMTLVLGLVCLLGRGFKVNKKEVLIVGVIEVFAVIMVILVVQIGLTRLNAFLLIASWPIFLFITSKTTEDKTLNISWDAQHKDGRHFFHLALSVLSFVGVAIGATIVVQSVILLAEELLVSEFLISFFVVGVGTSLPELVVDLKAIRKGQYNLAFGDVIGSCIVDALISIPIGPLLFPTAISTELAMILGLYVILASCVVVLSLAFREKVDRKAGVFFLVLYFLSYMLTLVI
jgi:cation:H+ antiporter